MHAPPTPDGSNPEAHKTQFPLFAAQVKHSELADGPQQKPVAWPSLRQPLAQVLAVTLQGAPITCACTPGIV